MALPVRSARWTSAWLAGLLLTACGEPRRVSELPPSFRAARVDVFLRATGGGGRQIQIDLHSVLVRDAQGAEHALELQRESIDSSEAARRLALAGGPVPRGNYQALIVELDGAALRKAGVFQTLRLLPQSEAPDDVAAEQALAEPAGVARYELPISIEVGGHDAPSLFLEWNVDASLVEGDGLRLALGVHEQRPQASLGLLYVADAAAGTILSFSPAAAEVVASSAAGPQPRALALSRNRVVLYTANAGDGSLSILDARTGWTRYSIPVQLTARCSDVAVVEGDLVATANPGVDTVSLFDARQLARVADIRVGRAPLRLVAAGAPRRLFVVEEVSNSVSVIDLASRTVVASIPVGSAPSALATDRLERELFVVHRNSPDLIAIDVGTLAVVGRFPVGDQASAVLADVRRDRIYVARARPPEIAVVDRRLATVLRRIRVEGRIDGLAQPLSGALMYGAAPELGALIEVDVLRGRQEAVLPCGTAPSDVVATD